ncbi:scpA/B family protein, partial [Clostridioides difficile CD127]
KIEVTFTNIIKSYENDEIIATFLSILELIKEKEIVVVQDIFFDDILIRKSSEC